MAGPIARVILVLKVFKVMELDKTFRGAKSGTLAAQAGRMRALPIPNEKVKSSRISGDIMPYKEQIARPKAAINRAICSASSMLRWLIRSAKVPAG